jgi:hypothetical protein
MASDTRAPNKRAGENVETAISRRVPALGLVPDGVAEHYDAVATVTVDPSGDLPMIGLCLLERGTLVEIKSVLVRYSDGARGRFNLRPSQHQQLLEAAGAYLFVVCESGQRRTILATKVVPASIVDELLPSDWFDGGDNRENFAQLSWGRFFDAEEVGEA